jgi:hypothetical protein
VTLQDDSLCADNAIKFEVFVLGGKGREGKEVRQGEGGGGA